jgi:hypothetical protein
MHDELERICEEVVVAYFTVLSQHFRVGSDAINNFGVDIRAETQTKGLMNRSETL